MSTHIPIAIVGSGFSGMAAAIGLRDAGFREFVIFERADDIGGTWRDNTYPGCACDVESVLYSYSFAPNASWSRTYSPQPEIQAYLQDVYRRYELAPHMRFNHALHAARWDPTLKRWQLETSRGHYTCDVLVSAVGGLCEPAYPDLPGLDSFAGETFHSARWNHDYDLRGKRVAVIGTGASAIQFVPQIQPKVGKLTLFQRTPAWVIPRQDRPIGALEHALFARIPALQKLSRALVYARRELFVVGFRNPAIVGAAEKLALRHMARAVSDPVLRAKLTPDFRLGCKRVLVSNDYLPALTRPNVHVETHAIREVRPHSIVTADGVEHEVDAIIFGTGFKVADMPIADIVRGADGRTLAERWQGTPEAHLGTMVAGVPNLFLLLGPNTGLGHTSMVLQIESQVALLVEAMKHLRNRQLRTLEPRPEAQRAFVEDIARMTRGSVWSIGGCKSWYLDRNGKNSVLWPSFTFEFRRRLHFRSAEYQFDATHAHEAAAATAPLRPSSLPA